MMVPAMIAQLEGIKEGNDNIHKFAAHFFAPSPKAKRGRKRTAAE